MAVLGTVYVKYLFFLVALLTLVPIFICLGNMKRYYPTIEMFRKEARHISRTRSLLVNNSSNKHLSITNLTESDIVTPAIKTGTAIKDMFKPGFDEISDNICPNLGESVELLILITSAPPNVLQRQSIRDTWGGYAQSLNISVGFILGNTNNKTVQSAVKDEEKNHQDIIIAKFMDSYDNLTLKSISVMEWVDKYCPKTLFVLKTDDDVFINVNKLKEVVKTFNPKERAIYGRIAKQWKPVRNKSSKYNILLSQFSHEVFPSFTTGPAYIFPAIIVGDLYKTAMGFNYFKLEDVFLTGVVAESLNIKRLNKLEIANKMVSFNYCNLKKLVSIHKVQVHEQRRYWNILRESKKFVCRPFQID